MNDVMRNAGMIGLHFKNPRQDGHGFSVLRMSWIVFRRGAQ